MIEPMNGNYHYETYPKWQLLAILAKAIRLVMAVVCFIKAWFVGADLSLLYFSVGYLLLATLEVPTWRPQRQQ